MALGGSIERADIQPELQLLSVKLAKTIRTLAFDQKAEEGDKKDLEKGGKIFAWRGADQGNLWTKIIGSQYGRGNKDEF